MLLKSAVEGMAQGSGDYWVLLSLPNMMGGLGGAGGGMMHTRNTTNQHLEGQIKINKEIMYNCKSSERGFTVQIVQRNFLVHIVFCPHCGALMMLVQSVGTDTIRMQALCKLWHSTSNRNGIMYKL